MSTNFYVYPGKEYIPSVKELLDMANQKIMERLLELGISRNIRFDAEIQKIKDHRVISTDLNHKMIWDVDTEYAWFFTSEIAGGTDAHYYTLTNINREMTEREVWQEVCEKNLKAQQLRTEIDKSLDIGHVWYFRRSAGQPGIVNLAYGLIAASLAKITEGFIYSDDGAWDYKCFPALPDEFFGWYLKPELTSNNEYKEWSTNSIQSIIDKLK